MFLSFQNTSGFVCSVAGFMAKLTGGVYYMTVQNFYPSNRLDAGRLAGGGICRLQADN